ncbi:hypothetical protein CsSME_00028033 [Camellia sinensis var. sinensis]
MEASDERRLATVAASDDRLSSTVAARSDRSSDSKYRGSGGSGDRSQTLNHPCLKNPRSLLSPKTFHYVRQRLSIAFTILSRFA